MKSRLIISLFQTLKISLDFTVSEIAFRNIVSLFVDLMTKPQTARHKNKSRMFARHYNVNDVVTTLMTSLTVLT